MTGGRGPSPQVFRKRQIFGNFTASLENFRTVAVGKDRDFEFLNFIGKSFELAPPPSLYSVDALESQS